jgi:hypothetical protein
LEPGIKYKKIAVTHNIQITSIDFIDNIL